MNTDRPQGQREGDEAGVAIRLAPGFSATKSGQPLTGWTDRTDEVLALLIINTEDGQLLTAHTIASELGNSSPAFVYRALANLKGKFSEDRIVHEHGRGIRFNRLDGDAVDLWDRALDARRAINERDTVQLAAAVEFWALGVLTLETAAVEQGTASKWDWVARQSGMRKYQQLFVRAQEQFAALSAMPIGSLQDLADAEGARQGPSTQTTASVVPPLSLDETVPPLAANPSKSLRGRRFRVATPLTLTAVLLVSGGIAWLNLRGDSGNSLALAGKFNRSAVEIRPGNRVMIVAASGKEEIDTGLLVRQFQPGELRALQRNGWRPAEPGRWAQELGLRLSSRAEQARLEWRLQNTPRAFRLFHDAMLAEDTVAGVCLAARLSKAMDSRLQVQSIRQLRQLTRSSKVPVADRVAALEALLTVDQASGPEVAHQARKIIRATDDNGVRIPAYRLLAKATPRAEAEAVSYFCNLWTTDRNNGIRAMAMAALIEFRPGFSREALYRHHWPQSPSVPWLTMEDTNDGVRRQGWNVLLRILQVNPEVLTEWNGTIPLPLRASIINRIGQRLSEHLLGLVKAESLEEMHRYVDSIDDVLIDHPEDSEAVTAFLALKVAKLLRTEERSDPVALNALIEMMRSKRAQRWALYRHGCARAIAAYFRPADDGWVSARLVGEVTEESPDEFRLAVAVALEAIRDTGRRSSQAVVHGSAPRAQRGEHAVPATSSSPVPSPGH